MLNFGRRKQSYADRLRGTSVAPGMVAPAETPYRAQLNELSERLNTNYGKTMRTSVAPDIYEPIKVLGEPRTPVQGPVGSMPDPKRAPRIADRSTGRVSTRPRRDAEGKTSGW